MKLHLSLIILAGTSTSAFAQSLHSTDYSVGHLLERRGGGRRGGLQKLCMMDDASLKKLEESVTGKKMKEIEDCMHDLYPAPGDCFKSTYGSFPRTISAKKAVVCPPDATKQAAFQTCMQGKPKPGSDLLPAIEECKASRPPYEGQSSALRIKIGGPGCY
ncbi:hypothetical protein P7C70_g3274, partial [Phenoliferia sp. Uapishka_3]